MTPQTFKVMFATFSYGGNGGVSSCHPDTRDWLITTFDKVKKDARVSEHRLWELSDTPISMSRNRCVLDAIEWGADALIMLDSDMRPDCEATSDPSAKPFWDTAFDFFCEMYDKHPIVIAAPYMGPPPQENPYIFRWENCQTANPDECDCQLKAFTRYEAAIHAGIQPVGALPTGLILYDTRVFMDLLDPMPRYRQLRDLGLTDAEACRATQHFFDYEWKTPFAADKGSTEDVQNTRDISLAGIQKYGSNPVHCNWDAWAGHWKPKLVRKPQILTADSVSRSLADVVLRGNESGMRIEKVDFSGGKVMDTMVEDSIVDRSAVGDDSPAGRKIDPHGELMSDVHDEVPLSFLKDDPSSHTQVF